MNFARRERLLCEFRRLQDFLFCFEIHVDPGEVFSSFRPPKNGLLDVLLITACMGFVTIHGRVFISRPGHMQITRDTEGYLSIAYSKSTNRTNMAAGHLSQGALMA